MSGTITCSELTMFSMVFELCLVLRGVHVCVCLHMLFLNMEFAPSCLEEKHMEKRGFKETDFTILHRCIVTTPISMAVQACNFCSNLDKEPCQHSQELLFLSPASPYIPPRGNYSDICHQRLVLLVLDCT